ncbi:MAG: succinylglutamate-semialdehyde dehydrogenase [Pseudomonadota bacterium]
MAKGAYIAGAWVEGEGDRFEKTCPATGAVIWNDAAASREQVSEAVKTARSAAPDWSLTPQAQRTAILEAYAEALAVRKQAIAEAISRDMGKALWESEAEAGAMIGKVAISIRAQAERAGNRETEAAFGSMALTHHPHGVMAVLGPYNFPGHLPNGHIVPALLAGNTCVLKPSELAPSVSVIMAEAFEAAGLPEGCLCIVQGGRDTGAALVESDIEGLLFTGSARTGTAFHKAFGGRPEVLLALEMGGNNPLIVWDPADVDAAADIAAQSAFFTTGQRCSCARRLIVPDTNFGEDVIDAIAERIDKLAIGAWNEPGIFMGPLVSEAAAEAAVAFQDDLIGRGAETVRKLSRMDRGGGFVTAGLLDVTDAIDVPDEELFGPLLQVIRVPDFHMGIGRANDTRFGLSGGLVCDDDQRWADASRMMRAGILNRNRPTAGASGAMPFGGPGLSGNHRPSAYYAADYCAWPQASQVAARAERLTAPGFPT